MNVIIMPDEIQEQVEGRVVRFAERPITFDAFLELAGDRDVELVNGVMVEKMSAQLDHERLGVWLNRVLGNYVDERGIGDVLGSRTLVELGTFGSRMPDVLFVRRERMDIVREKAVYGVPDFVIEIASPNDRRSDFVALETEYIGAGVPEIVFIDMSRQRVRVLRRQGDGKYAEELLTSGMLRLTTLDNIELDCNAILYEPRPSPFAVASALLHSAHASDQR